MNNNNKKKLEFIILISQHLLERMCSYENMLLGVGYVQKFV